MKRRSLSKLALGSFQNHPHHPCRETHDPDNRKHFRPSRTIFHVIHLLGHHTTQYRYRQEPKAISTQLPVKSTPQAGINTGCSHYGGYGHGRERTFEGGYLPSTTPPAAPRTGGDRLRGAGRGVSPPPTTTPRYTPHAVWPWLCLVTCLTL